MTDSKPALLRVLGVAFGVAILIGSTVSTGILRTPGEVAAAMPSAPWFLGVWVAGGLYAMLGALTLAELSVMIPKSGGNYVFARRAFGEYPGFLVGWTDWVSSGASVALAAITLGELATQVFPGVGSLGTIVAVGVVLVFTAIQWPGTKQSDLSQQILSVLKVLALMAIAVIALSSRGAAAPVAPPALPTGVALVTALVLVFQSVLYTYDGWNGVAYFGGEMKDPGKLIPRAMVYGVLATVTIYLALNAAFLHVLGIEGLAGSTFAASDTAKAVFGSSGETVVRLVMAVTLLGGVNALLMMSARVPYAMASDGLLPSAVATVNAGGTPVGALAATAVVTGALILSGTFNQVLALATFFYVLQYAVNFLAIFILRRTEPNTPRPYRAWGYPVIPAIVLVGALAFLGGSFKGDYANSMRAVWVIAGSVPVYFLSRRLMRSGPSS